MKISTYDLEDELDSIDVEQSMTHIAALVGLKDLKVYKQIAEREKHISSVGAAKLLSNMLLELTNIVAYTPAISRPTVGGEVLRTTFMDTVDHLNALRMAMVDSYNNDEGWSDVKVIREMEQYDNGKSKEADEDTKG